MEAFEGTTEKLTSWENTVTEARGTGRELATGSPTELRGSGERFEVWLPSSRKSSHKISPKFRWDFEDLCPKRKGEVERDLLFEKE